MDARLSTLRHRADLLRRLREFFDRRGFIEVTTPVLSAETTVDRHIDPVAVEWGEGDASRRMFLQTSPEAAMKRLLASGISDSGAVGLGDGSGDGGAGSDSRAVGLGIYQICPAVRRGERGPRHNPEFTICEWYRTDDDYAAGIALLGELADAMLQRGPARRLTYAEAFTRHVGIDPHRASDNELIAAARRLGVVAPESLATEGLTPDDRDAWLELLLAERIEPQLGRSRPAILYDYPASQAMLARTRRDGDGVEVAERFELYAGGIELANGYHELLDAAELRRRTQRANEQRRADGKEPLPEPTRLLAAMDAGLPPCSGCALGVDRLLMVTLGAKRIEQVLPLPIELA